MKHNWEDVKEFVSVYNNVKRNITKNNMVNKKVQNPELIDRFMKAFEEYFYQALKLKYVTKSNVQSVLNRLNGIQKVGYLVEPFKGKKSYSYKNKTGIFINPNLSDDMQVFSIFKELARVSSSFDREITDSTSQRYIDEHNSILGNNKLKFQYLDYGFRLLEDGINLDIAENIYSSYKKVPRIPKMLKNEAKVFGVDVSFLSNFRYMPSFQKLTTLIGRAIIDQPDKYDDEQVLFSLGNISLNEDFTKKMLIRLHRVFGKRRMFNIIGKLGIIYKKEMDNVESSFCINNSLRVVHAKKAFNDLNSIVNRRSGIILKKVS